MVYKSTVTFTLDAVTYLAKKRLDQALTTFQSTSPLSSNLSLCIQFHPFQLFPDLPDPSSQPLDRGTWYKETKFNLAPDPEVAVKAYEAMISEKLGEVHPTTTGENGIRLSTGQVQSSLPALALIWYVQEEVLERKQDASEKLSTLVDEVYNVYFRKGLSPSSPDALVAALLAVGIDGGKGEAGAKEIVEDATAYSGMRQVKNKIQEVQGNGIDAVPVVMFEGRRRDITLTGAKEVAEYIKALETVAKESA
ncbi:dsba oxidoreductase [Zalerion maritima]|uniref:Dsba oxidoreductase n=1 Tax=Zalerion maritima TaxID=339359 RepID=A0AAD5RI76_9PEZI|nr:dsba oxidoreductase [Zalerion maritima]